jgi:hypothetical protein
MFEDSYGRSAQAKNERITEISQGDFMQAQKAAPQGGKQPEHEMITRIRSGSR